MNLENQMSECQKINKYNEKANNEALKKLEDQIKILQA